MIAGIVLFNPDVERLRQNINAIKPQVERIICVDNGSQNIEAIETLLLEYEIKDLIKNGENKGIAAALNQICEFAKSDNQEWALTLDQDSVCPDNLMEEYSKHLHIPNLGMLTPVVEDRNIKWDFESSEMIEDMDRCITSACLTNISAWEKAGKFDEELFIDYVDYDLCAKMKIRGYRIVRVNTTFLLHEIGQGSYGRLVWRRYTIGNHSSFRKYYIYRNAYYYYKVYQPYYKNLKEPKILIKMFIKTILGEKNKWEKAKAMFRGYRDGKKLYKKRAANSGGKDN